MLELPLETIYSGNRLEKLPYVRPLLQMPDNSLDHGFKFPVFDKFVTTYSIHKHLMW